MLVSTLPKLRCPACQERLELRAQDTVKLDGQDDVLTGALECASTRHSFPILAGIAILVEDVREYLLTHVKGISKAVPDSAIPRQYRQEYLEAKHEIQIEHIEEDLEAERVVSLYLMNHYLSAREGHLSGQTDPLIASLIEKHWDQGPLARIATWIRELSAQKPLQDVVEVGCGVGGLARTTAPHVGSYLGMDTSFASIRLARHLNLGAKYPDPIRIPQDLLFGPKTIALKPQPVTDGRVDFIVGDLENAPLLQGQFDAAIALNAIDMLPEPAVLPKLQHALLKKGGVVIQSCPYIWHELVAKELRKEVPKEVRDSAPAVEWLYQKQGFELKERIDHLPWLFFKHLRQLEIYSVHLFWGLKK